MRKERVKRRPVIVCTVLFFLVACLPAKPIPPTATLLPWPTVDPNATPVSLAEIDLKPLLIQPGDLPAGMSGGQVTSARPPNPGPGSVFKGLPMSDNEIAQEFQGKGGEGGWVMVFLYKSSHDLATAYDLMVDGLWGSWQDPEGSATSAKKALADVGEKATIATVDYRVNRWPFKDHAVIVFIRCNAVVQIQWSGAEVAEAAISYAKRLDQRLSLTVCR